MLRQGAMRRLVPLLVLLTAACTTAPPTPVDTVTTAPLPALLPPRHEARADLVRVHKAARVLEVWSGDTRLLSLGSVQLGRTPVGPKRFEGDGRTPEGRYRIDWRNPNSAYHLSLHVSYPDEAQSAYARAMGRSAGGLIMIHGQPNGLGRRMAGDWTDGCIAVSDAEMETLWALVPDGATVEILP